MGLVNYNQSGYVGSSMSENAVLAYEQGEKPKSKWTKAAMIEAIKEYCYDMDLVYDSSIEKMKKDEIFVKFFAWSSWHHTGKSANETDFYAIDEEAVYDTFPEADEETLAQRAKEREALREKEQERLQKQLEEEKAWEQRRKETGYGQTFAALVEGGYPNVEIRLSQKGNPCIYVTDEYGKVHTCLVREAERSFFYGYIDTAAKDVSLDNEIEDMTAAHQGLHTPQEERSSDEYSL